VQPLLWTGTGAMLALAAFAGWRERRRKRRTDLDRIGLINWPTVQVFALIGLLVFANLAFRS
jgi:hypothetical protein